MRRLLTLTAAVAAAGTITLGIGVGELSPHSISTLPAVAETPVGDAATALAPLPNPEPTVLPGADADQLAASIRPSVVTVWSDLPAAEGFTMRGAGTGILLGEDGLVLTNNHVIAGSTRVRATHVDTGADYAAEVLGYDRTRDIAVLQLRDDAGRLPSGLPAAPLGDPASAEVGDPVVAVGNAGGTGVLTTSPGAVTALDQTITAEDDQGRNEKLGGVIQIEAGIRPGDSGGPLLDATGRVIGINTAASKSADPDVPGGRGFAVPITDALIVADHVRGGASVDTVHVGPTAVLGVTVVDHTAIPAGAEVLEVLPGTAAEKIRLRPGDVVIRLDDAHIAGVESLTAQLDRHGPGDSVVVHWVDTSGNRFSATAVLTEGLPA